ncbi:MAG TPA: hypothetical protein VFG29_09965 [Syntrophales bacterium]|nr:hypothetical protein [Syntrophales bacterium]
MFPSLNISGQGKCRGRENTMGGSSSLISWARAGLIIMGACMAIFSKPARPELSREEEKELLEKKASRLREQLAEIENRIDALEGKPAWEVVERDGQAKGNTIYD